MKNKKDQEAALNPLPIYPAAEDIYNKSEKAEDVDPENIAQKKTANWDKEESNEKDFKDDLSGDDLDIPGAELDDADEVIGNEDEENNYYSIGGDNHNELEEDNAD